VTFDVLHCVMSEISTSVSQGGHDVRSDNVLLSPCSGSVPVKIFYINLYWSDLFL